MENFNEVLSGVIRRIQGYGNDLSKVEGDNPPDQWPIAYRELADYIIKECVNLKKVVDEGDGAELLPTGQKRKPPGRVKLHERAILDHLYDVIKNGKHILFDQCDIFDTNHIARIMLVFEDQPGYFHRALDNRLQVAKALGSMIARDGVFTKKKGTEYTPVDPDAPKGSRKKKSNKVCNLWIIRNEEKYQHMGPADFYREYKRQKQASLMAYREEFERLYPDENAYNNDNKRVITSPKLEEAPSFL